MLRVPALLERARGIPAWQAQREDVISAHIADSRMQKTFFGGFGARLEIGLRDGSTELFLVYRPERTLEKIREWIAEPVR